MDSTYLELIKLEEALDEILYDDVGLDTPVGKKLSQLQLQLSKIITKMKG
jgi:hypothetical protein